uniref:Uncharacterized protein n=1 Tax=Nelumbo nucifera TaxID=4432 RepID=A0A822XPL1_NELNU|nr:TPA_asm: hypothetical protein HUJ06_022138 [Nelumbo nucifera]
MIGGMVETRLAMGLLVVWLQGLDVQVSVALVYYSLLLAYIEVVSDLLIASLFPLSISFL